MPRKIVITTDHEIFGNGTGDVRRHAVEPTEAMCRIGERHGVPLTVFFEMEEFLAFDRHAAVLRRRWGYDPAAEMRDQAADLARRGHDMQLHLHPQWHGADWTDDGWHLDMGKLTVDALFETAEETCAFIESRQAALREMVGRPVVAYRAGGFAAQPGRKLLRALARAGFVIGSSVVRGLKRSVPTPLDFRSVPPGRMWKVADDVCRSDPAGSLWEIPIHSVMRRRIHQLTPQRILAKFSGHVPKPQQQAMVRQLQVGKNPVKVARFLAQAVPIKLDYHNIPPRSLMRMIRSAPAPAGGELDVLVLIGHSKEHVSDARFARFCRQVAEDPDIEAVTFQEVAGMLRGNETRVEGRERTPCVAV